MNFIKRGMQRIAIKALGAIASMTHPRQFSWNFLFPGTKIDYEQEMGSGLESNLFLAPIFYVARNFPAAKLALRIDDGKNQTVDAMHPAARLIRRPNPFYSGSALWLATLVSWFLDGNAYWMKVRGTSGEPAELWYVPHWLIAPAWDPEGKEFITHYKYSPGGVPRDIATSEVVHMRFGLDPENIRLGMGQLRTALREAYNDSEAFNLVAALLKNKGVPGILISPDKDVEVGADDRQAIKDYVKEKFTGDNRFDPLVVGAATKVEQFGFNPKEMDLGVVHNVAEERVCALMGLPAAIVGFGAGLEQTKVGATMQELRKLAWTDCINPTQDLIADELNRSLLPDFDPPDKAELFFDRSKVGALQDNQGKQTERLDRAVRGGWVMVSEARKADGWDVDKSHEIFLRPMGVFEVDASGLEVFREGDANPALPAPAGGPKPPEPVEEEEEAEVGKQVKGRRRLTRIQARLLRVTDRIKRRGARIMKERLAGFFDGLGAEIERAWLEVGKGAEDELRIHTLFSNLDMPQYEADLSAIFSVHYVSIFHQTQEATAGMGLVMNVPDAAQQRIFMMGGTQAKMVGLTESARNRAFDILADAREEGLGIPAIARRMREHLPAGRWLSSGTRAEVIARTETRNAQTQSSLEMYRGTDGVEMVMMLDNRMGPQPPPDLDLEGNPCAEVNGMIVTFDEAQHLLAVEHPNGTRDCVPHFEGGQ